MIRSELIAHISRKFPDIPEAVVAKSITALLEYVTDSLSSGERVELRGFGTFSLHFRRSRSAHNPKTGERCMTAPKYIPHFKAGKDLRNKINETRDKYPIQDELREED